MVEAGITSTNLAALDRIFAGNFPPKTESVTVKSGEGAVSRGQLLIQEVIGGKWVKYTSPTAVASEAVGSGNGTAKTFSATLANKNIAPGTVSVTAPIGGSNVTLYDDGEGSLKDASGNHVGTINYVTGDLSLTFGTAPDTGSNNITAAYSHFGSKYVGARPRLAVLADDVDATSADKAAGAFVTGEFNAKQLTPDVSSDTWIQSYGPKIQLFIE